MLKRIKIQGYKSLVDMEIELQPLTVLFGPNAAGKSNFLDALQLLSRLPTSTNLRDAFTPPYRGTILESFTFGPKGIEGLLEQRKVSFSIEIEVELSPKTIEATQRRFEGFWGSGHNLDNVKSLKYFIAIDVQPKLGSLKAPTQNITAYDINGEIIGKVLPIFSVQQSNNIFFDTVSFAKSPLISALYEELSSWLFFYLEPRERMRQPTAVRETRHIGLMGEDIAPFLNTLRALDEPQFKALEKALHLLIPEITGIDVGVNNRGDVEVRLMQGQTPLPASVLSEGTWRMLGLLALGGAKESPALLGFEEPENGISPQRLDLIASLLTNLTYNDTQVIVTTHSPTLLDALPQESLFMVRQLNGRTSIDPLARFDEKKHSSVSPASSQKNRLISERLLRGDFSA